MFIRKLNFEYNMYEFHFFFFKMQAKSTSLHSEGEAGNGRKIYHLHAVYTERGTNLANVPDKANILTLSNEPVFKIFFHMI